MVEAGRPAVPGLLAEIGFNPVDTGSLEMARHLESMAWLSISLQMMHGWSWQTGRKLIGPDGDAA